MVWRRAARWLVRSAGSAERRGCYTVKVYGQSREDVEGPASRGRFAFRTCVELFNDVGKFNLVDGPLRFLARCIRLSSFLSATEFPRSR